MITKNNMLHLFWLDFVISSNERQKTRRHDSWKMHNKDVIYLHSKNGEVCVTCPYEVENATKITKIKYVLLEPFKRKNAQKNQFTR